ncbi:hypothetical protein ACL03H_16755 [Saccharopolyspora sp. MS10]|uniref:hypothetical protein n=1 Tax=Saccharopolyspora sp. MS10 TaxID=3385973 RepID=UPI0039A29D21
MDPRTRRRPISLVPLLPRSSAAAPPDERADRTPAPATTEEITETRAAACSDAGLVAAIREREVLRHRFLRDQLTLLTEARRRGLPLPGRLRTAPARPGSDDPRGTPT